MKLPVRPPDFKALLSATVERHSALIPRLLDYSAEVDGQGRYLHWDKLRHLTAPDGFSHEQWWLATKLARQKNYKKLPLFSVLGQQFQYAQPSVIQRELHYLDRHASGAIQSAEAITNPQTRNTYLIRSLVEESISSSQIEGASTTLDVAKEMLRQQREPADKSEQMIMNNYQAMQFIREYKNELLTPQIVFELHRILTNKTLDDENKAGCFRLATDDIHVVDEASHVVLHTPPPAHELPDRLQALCDFANTDFTQANTDGLFLHPVIKAISLHFMLAYDHPFFDGNGRTARALFYWAMANSGYWLAEFISISKIIKQAQMQYGRAFLYTESDENDITYFLIHQLDVIHQAIKALHEFLDEKLRSLGEAEQILSQNAKLSGKLNFRQKALLRHALKHPRFAYLIDEHKNSHGISYDVARTDLINMSDELKLLDKVKDGKRYFFVAPSNLLQRIKAK